MRKTYLLLGSVSAVAIAAAATVAHAQDTTGGYTISVEGGGLFAKSIGADKLGEITASGAPFDYELDLNDNLGYRAAISLGTKIDNFWDVRASAAVNNQIDATSTITVDSGGPIGYIRSTTGFDYQTLDLEVGYTPELDSNFKVRLFGGVRGMHYDDRQSLSEGDDKVGITIDYKDEFIGAGPRIGAEGSARLGDSMFGISGSISAAAMYGVSTESIDFEYTGTGGPPPLVNDTMTTNKWVYNLEASLGLDAYLSDDATLTIGYRASSTSPVGENSYFLSSEEPETNRFSHGPTVKLTIQAD